MDRPPPPRRDDRDDYGSRPYRREPYADRPPRRDHTEKPPPSEVLGVFGLSVQTRESDLDYEFSRFGTVESVNIVYDQRVSPLLL
jgi:transformer-2 protein